MRKYDLSKEQRLFIEGMRLPFVFCQLLDQGAAALAVSDGFCELFNFKNRGQAYDGRLIYSVPFRRVFDREIRQYRMEFTRGRPARGEDRNRGGFQACG